MKQLVTSIRTASAGGGFTSVGIVSVQKQVWFPGKVIIMRCAIDTTITGFAGSISANIQEQIIITGGNTWTIPNAGPTMYSAGNGSVWRELRFIRQDPNITGVDYNQSMVHGAPNSYNGTSFVNTITPSGAGFDYFFPIDIEYQISVPGTLGTSSVGLSFLQGLIEQGTNLGKIY